MRLAIHNQTGCFSDRWIKYCSEYKIDYQVVNCYDSNILSQLTKVDGLLWHWVHDEPSAQLVAKQIIRSVEQMGIQVFPDSNTCWHYDDKVAQKYLLESIEAPLIPSYVFFNKKESIKWIEQTSFPKVFKLRCGAGSANVRLVKNQREAKKLCNKAFKNGFTASPGYFKDYKTKIGKIKNKEILINKLLNLPKSIRTIINQKRFLKREKGYLYFQDFLPNNIYDTRITIIGSRAFSFKRKTRPNDFRVSGSGIIEYDNNKIDKRCIQIAFDVTKKLKAQSLAFDFIYDSNKHPLIGEISYTYTSESIFNCPGYWDTELTWHNGQFWPQDLILSDMLDKIYIK